MEEYSGRHVQPTSHRRRWIILGIILLIIISCGWYLHHLIQCRTQQMVAGHQTVLPTKLRQGKPFSVLVMGTDVGALGRGTQYAGNTDTMELITVNPQRKQFLLCAIPRDTLVRVETNKGTDYVKINAAYAIGGASQAKNQVHELLDVPVDYYAIMNMGTLKKVVNAVGGVDVNNPFAFTYEGHHFKKGPQHLNGNNALKYSRMRYDDPNNDYGRQRRGQQVIKSVIASFKDHGSIRAANQIMTAIQDGVRTDIPINHVSNLYFNYHGALNNTKSTQLQEKDAVIDGTDFQIATPKELTRVSKLLRTSLGLKDNGPVHNHETELVHEQTTWNGYNQIRFRLPHGAQYNVPGSGRSFNKENNNE